MDRNPEPLACFIARLPKVELHVHLEGSVEPETLRELAHKKGRLADETETWISDRRRQGFQYRGFQDFLDAFKLVSLLLETPSDYALATTRLIEALAGQNVKYAEITVSAGVILWKKQSVQAIFEAVAEAAREASAGTGVRVNWIFDAIRHFGAEHARQVLKWTTRYRSLGVVAFGIGGDEVRGPAELFPEVFREARDLGLHVTAHAGEAAGPESVRNALALLGVERIGHGLTAARDPEVLALLRERGIPLEVCLTSNVATGLLGRIEDHPLPKFLEAGVTVTLNSDDPAMFATTLTQELTLAGERFALTPGHAVGFCENAVRSAFLPASEKEALLRGLRQVTESG